MLRGSTTQMLRCYVSLTAPAARRFTRGFSAVSTPVSTDSRIDSQVAANLMQIGIRRIFDHEHDMYRELCRRFYTQEVVPYHQKWEEEGQVDRKLWNKAGKEGMLCVTVPEQYGGANLDALYAAVHWEEQSYSGSSGPGFMLHSEIVAPYIVHFGTEEQKQKWLPGMCTGDIITAIAMTEPNVGSDLANMQTSAVKKGDEYIINGSKTYITNGYLSDMVIVCAKTDPSKGAKGISLFLVDTKTKGFNKGRKLKKMGMKAQDTCELFFEDMVVHKSCLLGEENKGFIYLMTELPQERILVGDQALASAEACFELTRTFVSERKAFGSTISALQTVKHTMASLKTEICVARNFADRCIELLKDNKLDNQSASMAKYWLTDLQSKVADACVQLHGGAGYMLEYPVARHFIDGRVSRIYGGSNEIMKELISRSIFEKKK